MEEGNLSEYLKDPAGLNGETLVKIKQMTEEYPYFQTAWMLYLKNMKVIGHPDFNDELQRNAIRVPERKKLHNLLNPSFNYQVKNAVSLSPTTRFPGTDEYFTSGTPASGKNTKGNDLIDHFIASQPTVRIKTKDEGDIPHNDFSEASVSENEEIITETFANILIQQKKYDKAIESFKKLSLKFPEKSAYFAGRIEEAEKLKDN